MNENVKIIIENVIGNNDPFWIEPVLQVVEKIINMKIGEESSITCLLGDTASTYSSKQLFDIYLCVNKTCKKLNILLDFSKNNAKVDGLLYNISFIKRDVK